MKRLGFAFLLCLITTVAQAQWVPRTTLTTKVTISVTNTYQQALASNSSRASCTIQNEGTHTMFVFFGAAAPADTTTSFQLTQGQAINCTVGGIVLIDAVQITGTAGDIAVVTSQQ